MIDLGSPDICHCLAARRSARWITRHYDAALAPVGITCSQFSVLSILGYRRSLKIADLADLMVMERTSLVRSLKPLISAGLVSSKSEFGQRAKYLSLSARGMTKLSVALPVWQSAQRMFEQTFGEEAAARVRESNIQISFLGA